MTRRHRSSDIDLRDEIPVPCCSNSAGRGVQRAVAPGHRHRPQSRAPSLTVTWPGRRWLEQCGEGGSVSCVTTVLRCRLTTSVRTTTDAVQAADVARPTSGCSASCRPAGLTAGGACEVSVKATVVVLVPPEHGEKTATENIARICAAARDAGTTVTLDAEHHTAVDATLRIAAGLPIQFADLGCVVQVPAAAQPGRLCAADQHGRRGAGWRGRLDEPADVAFSRRRTSTCRTPLPARLNRRHGVSDGRHRRPWRLIHIATTLALMSGRPADRFENHAVRHPARRATAPGRYRTQVRAYVPIRAATVATLWRVWRSARATSLFFLAASAPSPWRSWAPISPRRGRL